MRDFVLLNRGDSRKEIPFPLVLPGLVATILFFLISAWVFFVLVQRCLVSGLGGAVKD